jgi:hypothetical protein
MDQPRSILAERKNFGRVYDCECGSVHVQVGGVNVAFSIDGYMEFVDLINTSAANFEGVLDRARGSGEGDQRAPA